MYMHAMELVWLGDTSTNAYDRLIALFNSNIAEMQPYAEARDGPELEDRLAENGAMVQVDKEVIQRSTEVKPAPAVSGDNFSVFMHGNRLAGLSAPAKRK